MTDAPGLLRLAFCVPCFRLLSCTKLTREILFSMLAILPAYTNVFLLLLMVIYMYNVIGCIMFGGMFRFLDDGMYDMQSINQS